LNFQKFISSSPNEMISSRTTKITITLLLLLLKSVHRIPQADSATNDLRRNTAL
jgi:hypothetical protein